MNTKNIVVVVVLVVLIAFGLLGFLINRLMHSDESPTDMVTNESLNDVGDGYSLPDIEPGRYDDPSGSNNIPNVQVKTETFTGILEEVNTGCFADAECYVVVDGKRVTVLVGWSQTTVGSVRGVQGIGDLELYIGSPVEVYAQAREDGSYTLYGDEAFYVQTLGDAAVPQPIEPLPGDQVKPQIVRDGCMVGGCSSQVCGEASAVRDMITTCEYREEYACYQVATCERQSDGQCGWTQTAELTQCLSRTQ